MPIPRRCLGLAAMLLCAAGCASSSSQLTTRQECYDPDTQLANLLAALDAQLAQGCRDRDSHDPPSVCESLRREIERLAVVCPNHVPTLMTNAVMAHESGRSTLAQQYLDRIFERPSSHPDAAVLRGQIAIEDGNLPFARRFLEQQIKLAPDHAGLLEAYAAALYLARQMDDARLVLERAEALGAPRWRIAYHLGLIAEAAGQMSDARRLFQEAVEKNPGWAPAQQRLKGLIGR